MLSRFARAASIYRDEGPAALARKSLDHVARRARRFFRDTYWNVNGGQMVLSVGETEATFDGPTDAGGDAIRWRHVREREMLRSLVGSLDEGAVFLDVGAAIGVYSCFASNAVGSGHIIAVEPYDPNREQLKRNLSHNPADFTVLDYALSDKSGSAVFSIPRHPSVGSGTQSIAADRAERTVSVQTVPGDELVDQGHIPQPNIVKIDVEGAEDRVISGLEQTLRHQECRLLFCEVHLPTDERLQATEPEARLEAFRNRINDLGFRIDRLDRRGPEVHIEASASDD